MRHLMILCGIYCLLDPSLVLANTSSPIPNSPFIATISAGPAWYHAGKTQSIYLQPGFENTYVANTPIEVLASGELFLGIQQSIYSGYLGQLGVAVATSSSAVLQGVIWETSDPAFDNFTYQYKEKHTHVAIKGKLLSEFFSTRYLPYVSASLGVAFNRAYQFSSMPVIFEVLPQPPFQPNTATSLTYTLGVGLQQSLTQHWQLGVGYEFADWGSSMFSPSSIQTINHGLSLNHLYTHQLQFSLSYLK